MQDSLICYLVPVFLKPLLIIICNKQDGDRFWRIPETYIRGNTIKYLRVPDEVCTAPSGDSHSEDAVSQSFVLTVSIVRPLQVIDKVKEENYKRDGKPPYYPVEFSCRELLHCLRMVLQWGESHALLISKHILSWRWFCVIEKRPAMARGRGRGRGPAGRGDGPSGGGRGGAPGRGEFPINSATSLCVCCMIALSLSLIQASFPSLLPYKPGPLHWSAVDSLSSHDGRKLCCVSNAACCLQVGEGEDESSVVYTWQLLFQGQTCAGSPLPLSGWLFTSSSAIFTALLRGRPSDVSWCHKGSFCHMEWYMKSCKVDLTLTALKPMRLQSSGCCDAD